jgi:ABC-type multidrug transport system fused ATPase/permease subunit
MNSQGNYRNLLQLSRTFLSPRDHRKLLLITLAQICLALLDLISVLLIGIVTSLSISVIQSNALPAQAIDLVEYLQIENLSFQGQVAALGSIAGALMIAKTLASVYLIRKMLNFLAFKAGNVSAKLSVEVMQLPYEYIKQNSSQSILYSVTTGVNSLIVGIVGSTIQIASETFLIIIMFTGLFVIEPIVSIGALVYFLLIAFVQQRFLGSKALQLGSKGAEASVAANQKTIEALSLYREIYVRQALDHYSQDISKKRRKVAAIDAARNFLPLINKYTLEISLVVAALLLSATQFLLTNAVSAVATLAVFLTAALRISPAILRLQQALVGIKSSQGSALLTFQLMEKINRMGPVLVEDSVKVDLNSEIQLSEVKFTYQDSNIETIKGISFTIRRGELIALIGPSGGGKSTLVDLILGLLQPQSGDVRINGFKPREYIELGVGKIGYVAQDATLLNGSVKENLIFGVEEKFTDKYVHRILEKVALSEFISSLDKGLDEIVGERGVLLSGGQRQRLNLARAIITDPDILILDEATSALDVDTEQQIISSIEGLRGKKTIIVVAHRLSTVLNADNIFFIKNGLLLGQGNFKELRRIVPDFDKEANLAGFQNLD